MSIPANDVMAVARARTALSELALLDDVKCGLADIAFGCTEDADKAIARLQQARRLAAEATQTTKTTTRRG